MNKSEIRDYHMVTQPAPRFTIVLPCRLSSMAAALMITILIAAPIVADQTAPLYWHTVSPDNAEIIIGSPVINPHPETLNYFFGAEYSYRMILINNRKGKREIPFDPSIDKVILNMRSGEIIENLDLSAEASRKSSGVKDGHDANLIREWFGELSVTPGGFCNGIVVFPPDIDFTKVEAVTIKLRTIDKDGLINHLELPCEPLEVILMAIYSS